LTTKTNQLRTSLLKLLLKKLRPKLLLRKLQLKLLLRKLLLRKLHPKGMPLLNNLQ
jgi:hypothetical protein